MKFDRRNALKYLGAAAVALGAGKALGSQAEAARADRVVTLDVDEANPGNPTSGFLRIFHHSTDGLLKARASDGTTRVLDRPLKRATVHLPAPEEGDAVGLFRTSEALSVVTVGAVRSGGTSVTWNIRHATTRNAGSPSSLFNSNVTTTAENDSTPEVDNVAIAADRWVWLEITGVSGEVDIVEVSLEARVA